MTPIIDIVFLLIIFFMLVCQFIVAENFEVDVPDKITKAVESKASDDKNTTVTVMQNEAGQVAYAVGADIIGPTQNHQLLAQKITNAINIQLENVDAADRLVTLRIDKTIAYQHCQPAIRGISLSSASELKLAAIKDAN